VEIFAPPRAELDLTNLPDNFAVLLDGVSAVINCGAYTAVDKAESEQWLAEAVNSTAPDKIARAAARACIPIVHVSTDYVFPANGDSPWREDAKPGPVNVYGRTKLAGEDAVRASGARYAIVRTAWVVSAHGANFVKTMLRLGEQNELIRVVADQLGTPTHAGDLAAALATITRRFIDDPLQSSGTWHCVNAGETTWFGLASHIFACAAARGLSVPRKVEGITTAEYPTPARRPNNSRLDCARISADFGLALRPWQDAVEEIVTALAKEKQVS
jgi:dTDP-4-dehydrorhamnose reductase